MVAARPSGSSRALVVGVVTAVMLVVGAGLLLVGSPGEARKRRLDDRRLDDLRALTVAVEEYQVRHHRLPDSLEDFRRDGRPADAKDPTTGKAYEYRAIESLSYELCATFERPSEDDSRPRWPADLSWDHPAGRHCFRRTTRP